MDEIRTPCVLWMYGGDVVSHRSPEGPSRTGLPSVASAAWTADWLDPWVRAPAEDRRELLRRLLSEDPDEELEALDPEARAACAAACGDALDLTDTNHQRLAASVVEALPLTEERAVAVLERFVQDATDGELSRLARMKFAIALAIRSRHRRSMELFRSLAREAAGEGTQFEVRALVNLATAYSGQHRHVEALAVLGRAEAVLESLTDTRGLAFALLRRAQLLATLGAADASTEVYDRIEALLAADPSEDLAGALLRERTMRAIETGRMDDARALLARMDAIVDPTELPGYYRGVRLSARISIAIACESPEAAGAELDELEALAAEWPTLKLLAVTHRAEFETRFGDSSAAASAIRDALRVLARSGSVGAGWGRVSDHARELLELARAVGDEDAAHAALDLAVTASLERIREIERGLDQEPDIATVSHADRALLARSRARFLRENRELCRLVAERVERGEDDLAVWTRRRLTAAEQGLRVLCAWCHQVRDASGRWLPVGHLVLASGSLDVTHGICPPCERGARS